MEALVYTFLFLLLFFFHFFFSNHQATLCGDSTMVSNHQATLCGDSTMVVDKAYTVCCFFFLIPLFCWVVQMLLGSVFVFFIVFCQLWWDHSASLLAPTILSLFHGSVGALPSPFALGPFAGGVRSPFHIHFFLFLFSFLHLCATTAVRPLPPWWPHAAGPCTSGVTGSTLVVSTLGVLFSTWCN